LPLTRKVLGGKPGWYDKAAFYERAKKVDEAVDFLKRYEEAGNTAAADRYAAEKAKLLDMEKPVRQARKALSAIRKERAALRQDLDQGRIDRAAYDKEMDALKADEQAELLAFNADYLSWVGKE
jgi:predicted  nucleic acid-binding Zn-ribbon protein